MKTIINQKAGKSEGLRIKANRIGLVFGIVFSLIILLLAAFPFGKPHSSKEYIYIAIYSIYPIGLFIGLKWKGIGAAICIAGFIFILISMISEFDLSIFSGNNAVFYGILFLIQMIPVTFYLISWYHFWKSKKVNNKQL